MAANSVPAPLTTPRLTIPDIGSIETEGGSIEFSIPTTAGQITVHGWGRRFWVCRGTVAALAECGLLCAEWLPGLPGNNKTRQTVMFTADGPKLRLGKKGGAPLGDDRITIGRISSQTYEVEVPMTAEQVARSEEANDRGTERLKQSRQDAEKLEQERFQRLREEQHRAWAMQRTPMELRLQMKGQIDMSEELLFDCLSGTRFRFSGDAERVIRDCYTRLRHLIGSGAMPNAAGERESSNVVQLR